MERKKKLYGLDTNKQERFDHKTNFGMAGFCGGIYSEDDIDILGVSLREL